MALAIDLGRQDAFTLGYLAAMTSDTGAALQDFAPKSLALVVADCEAFQYGQLKKPGRMVFGKTPPTTAVMAVLRGPELLTSAGRWFWNSRQGNQDGFNEALSLDPPWGGLLHDLACTFPTLGLAYEAGLITLVPERP